MKRIYQVTIINSIHPGDNKSMKGTIKQIFKWLPISCIDMLNNTTEKNEAVFITMDYVCREITYQLKTVK
jgi:hypothetical protein